MLNYFFEANGWLFNNVSGTFFSWKSDLHAVTVAALPIITTSTAIFDAKNLKLNHLVSLFIYNPLL